MTASLVGIISLTIAALGVTVAVMDPPALGLDLQGGVSVVLQPKGEAAPGALDQAIEIIRNRVDGLGVAEPEITRQGGAIVVALPGVEDQERALELVGQTAELRFRPVLEVIPAALAGLPGVGVDPVPSTDGTGEAPAPDTTAAPAPDTSVALATDTSVAPATDTSVAPATGRALQAPAETTVPTETTVPAETTVPDTTVAPGTAPPDSAAPGGGTLEITDREADVATEEVVLPLVEDGEIQAIYRLGPALLTGSAIESAEAQFSAAGTWSVGVVFRSGDEGIGLFNAMAARCAGAADQATCPTGAAAITLDGEVVSAPTIQQSSFTRDQVEITGQFSEREAKDLALVLRYGSLPVELEPQAVQTVSATLGKDSLRAGIIAGLVGVGLVVLLMIAFYRVMGLVALFGLGISAALLWAVVAWLGETSGLTLTLAGATGIIVSVGVTVDSYVVYFERLKDDMRSGRTMRSSAERGFSTAFRTILAADIASLIGAAVLYVLTVGSVRGFAFFLALSTVLDIVVAYFFTRPMVTWLSRTSRGERLMGPVRRVASLAPAAAPAGGTR